MASTVALLAVPLEATLVQSDTQSAPPSTVATEAPPEFEQAVAALQEGDLERARDLLEPFRDHPETPPQVLTLLGTIYIELGEAERALEVLSPLAEQTDQPAVLYHAGRAALAAGDTGRAKDFLARSVELEPATPAARELGLLHGRRGEMLAAYRLLKPWAQRHPDDSEARLVAALAAVRLGRISEAEQLLSDLPQDDPRVRLLWGRLLLLRGDPHAAIATLKPLIGSGEAAEADARGTLAEAYVEIGESERAIELLEGRAGDDPGMRLTLAISQYQSGGLEAALDTLAPIAESLMEADTRPPATADISREYGRMLVAAGRHGDAIPHLELATELEPRTRQSWKNLGQALAAVGRDEEAEEALARFRELTESAGSMTERRNRAEVETEDPVTGSLNRARELAAAGDVAAAVETLEAEIDISPDDPRPRLLLSQLLLHDDRLDDALAAAEGAVDIAPRDADAQYLRGAVHLARGELEAAERDLRAALELAPRHTAAMNDLAVLLMSRGETAEARELLERVLEIRPQDEQARRNLEQLPDGASSE